MPAIEQASTYFAAAPKIVGSVSLSLGAICDVSIANQQASAWIYSEPAATESAAIKKMPAGKICAELNSRIPAEAEVNNPVVEPAQPQLSQAEAIAAHA